MIIHIWMALYSVQNSFTDIIWSSWIPDFTEEETEAQWREMTGSGSRIANHKGRTPSLMSAVISSRLIRLLSSQPLRWAQGTEQRGRRLWWPALTKLTVRCGTHITWAPGVMTGELWGAGPGMTNGVPQKWCAPPTTAPWILPWLCLLWAVSVISFGPSLGWDSGQQLHSRLPTSRGIPEHLPLSCASLLSSITTGPSPTVLALPWWRQLEELPALQMNDPEEVPSRERAAATERVPRVLQRLP